MDQADPSEPLRPRDLALLLAASEHTPRQRARDQQADRAGMVLRRRVLERLAVLDPEPLELDAALARIIEEFGPPTGPTRAIALTIREEWHAACAAPDWIAHLLGEAASASEH